MFHIADVLAQERAGLDPPQAGWTSATAIQRLRGRKRSVLPETAPALFLPRGDADLEPLRAALTDVETHLGPAGVEALVISCESPVLATASSPEPDGERLFSLISVAVPSGQHAVVVGLFIRALPRRRGKPLVLRSVEAVVVDADVEHDVRSLLERAHAATDQPYRMISARGRDRAPKLGWYGLPRDQRLLPPAWLGQIAAAAAVDGYELVFPSTSPHDDSRRAVREIKETAPELIVVWHPHAPPSGVRELAPGVKVPVLDLLSDDPAETVKTLREELAPHPVRVRRRAAGPGTVADAVEQARERSEHIVFHDRVARSARASPFERPEDILKGLMAIDAVAGRYFRRQLYGGGFTAAFQVEGQTFASGISQTARNQYRAYYEITYEGAHVLIEPHLRFGGGWSPAFCARIYWYVDEDKRLLVVGHVGKHLPGARG